MECSPSAWRTDRWHLGISSPKLHSPDALLLHFKENNPSTQSITPQSSNQIHPLSLSNQNIPKWRNIFPRPPLPDSLSLPPYPLPPPSLPPGLTPEANLAPGKMQSYSWLSAELVEGKRPRLFVIVCSESRNPWVWGRIFQWIKPPLIACCDCLLNDEDFTGK